MITRTLESLINNFVILSLMIPHLTMPCSSVGMRSIRASASVLPHQQLIEVLEELLPAESRATECLRLIGPETRLLHAKMGAGAGRSECKGHHASQVVGVICMRMIPGVGQRLVRFDGENLAIQHAAPV